MGFSGRGLVISLRGGLLLNLASLHSNFCPRDHAILPTNFPQHGRCTNHHDNQSIVTICSNQRGRTSRHDPCSLIEWKQGRDNTGHVDKHKLPAFVTAAKEGKKGSDVHCSHLVGVLTCQALSVTRQHANSCSVVI